MWFLGFKNYIRMCLADNAFRYLPLFSSDFSQPLLSLDARRAACRYQFLLGLHCLRGTSREEGKEELASERGLGSRPASEGN